jgi:F-type H+-transporting ATPase subunit delta
MSKHASIEPYAKALFAVALAEHTPEVIGRELSAFAAMVADHGELAALFAHPAVPPRVKRDIVNQLAEQATLSPPLRKLLRLLADRDRLELLPRLAEAYEARLLQHLGVVEAHVTTAVPLPPERVASLEQGLSRATGKQIRLATAVDPGILGGVVARLGSKVFDGSVAHQLSRLRQELASEGA